MELNILNIGVEQIESTEVEEPSAPVSEAPTEQSSLPHAAEAASPEAHAAGPQPKNASATSSLTTPADEVAIALALVSSSEPSSGPEAEPQAVPSSLQETLDQHLVWLHSEGRAGRQANLCRAELSGADLTDANLRDAVLHKAVLKGADLLLTDFQGASLLQADLQGANMLGARLQDANLQGATLQDVTGLQGQQLAGANLFGAALPAQVSVPSGLQHLRGLARLSGWLILAMVTLCALTSLRIITTTDVRLLVNAPVLPVFGLENLLLLVPFYLCGPAALLGLYICFHLGLQHLWDGAAAQPAIFPDGRRLDACLPWFARWPARSRMKWLREHRPSLAALEAGISMLLLYWLVPLTMVLFWARYLTMQDLRGSMLHVLLVVAASAAALYFTRAAGRAYKTSSPHPVPGNPWIRRAIAPSLGLALALLSFGAIRGVPHNARRAPDSAGGPQTWASDLLWWAGYTPTAQLAELDVSVKPAGWTGRDQDLAGVEGARLNGLRLRYIQAYGAYFAKARLWQSDLSHANLSETDLREANLRQASLQGATVDKARLARAVLQEADLRGANLTQSDLQDSNLSRALMSGALLPDAKLDGANLYASDLHDGILQRASLQHADLRDANLEGADLGMAILRQTYLSSAKMSGSKLRGAQLAQAFLTQADLRKADLRGAGMQGAILNGANLTGANLDRVDFRGALGLTASQVCSAGSARQIQLDEMLQHEVESQCASKFGSDVDAPGPARLP
jgi:uncharacterized protein YjbI with pentapeptide repeats